MPIERWRRLAGLAALALIAMLVMASAAHAQSVPVPAPSGAAIPGALDRAFGALSGAQGKGSLALSMQLLLIMGLLTILPSIVLMMTSFTRILIVLSLRPRGLLGERAF